MHFKMLKYTLIVATLVCAMLKVQAQKPFEGIINMAATNEATGEKASIAWKVKNDQHRLDYSTTSKDGNFSFALYVPMGGESVVMVSRGTEKDLKYVIPATAFQKPEVVFFNATLEKERGTRLIAGINCQEYSVLGAGSRAVVWVGDVEGLSSSDFPRFMHNNGLFSLLKRNGLAGIPLELNVYNEYDELSTTQSIIGMQRTSVSDRDFEVPDVEAGN